MAQGRGVTAVRPALVPLQEYKSICVDIGEAPVSSPDARPTRLPIVPFQGTMFSRWRPRAMGDRARAACYRPVPLAARSARPAPATAAAIAVSIPHAVTSIAGDSEDAPEPGRAKWGTDWILREGDFPEPK